MVAKGTCRRRTTRIPKRCSQSSPGHRHCECERERGRERKCCLRHLPRPQPPVATQWPVLCDSAQHRAPCAALARCKVSFLPRLHRERI